MVSKFLLLLFWLSIYNERILITYCVLRITKNVSRGFLVLLRHYLDPN
jgi:hypothetical protein